ncbi:putative TetR family transcriptional regulator [Rhodococcus wratislaviensis NBRC 100605]|uniref:Putative TetR family transcriptional regulator n=1 Tax=Rhodococcus wratislaviensis NBRC 100605 TaxID=1219028 RepID=X0PW67_RHOWR|nr:putative TetR family transcriptional regulator [Rhodococcus wratislaviensis NBRC 100605]
MVQQQRAAVTRAQIVRGAAEMFDKSWFEGASLVEILEAAGMTKGALYFHFRSKEDLARHIIAEQHRISISAVQANCRGSCRPPGIPPWRGSGRPAPTFPSPDRPTVRISPVSLPTRPVHAPRRPISSPSGHRRRPQGHDGGWVRPVTGSASSAPVRVCEPRCRRGQNGRCRAASGCRSRQEAAAPRRWGGVGLDDRAAEAGVDRPRCGAAELRACVRIAGCAIASRCAGKTAVSATLSVRGG